MRRQTMRFLVVNGMSLFRLPLSMFFLYSYIDDNPIMHRASFAAIALAVVTDFADGALARRFHVSTKFGYLVDGITDRAAYVAVVLGIAMRNGFPVMLGYILIVRDFFLYGSRSYFPRWHEQLSLQRTVAHFHAGALRAVLGIYLMADATTSFDLTSREETMSLLHWMPHVTFALTCASYYALWLVFREQSRLHGYTPLDELER